MPNCVSIRRPRLPTVRAWQPRKAMRTDRRAPFQSTAAMMPTRLADAAQEAADTIRAPRAAPSRARDA